MAFSFSDEQEEFREVVRRFLEEKSPPGEVRRLMEQDEGYDPAVWRQLCDELGLPGLAIPEAYGGQGFGWVEQGIVLEEMGRVLLCAPYFSSAVLAAGAILHGASEAQRKELLPGIASGELLTTLAWVEPGGSWDTTGVSMMATPSGDEYRLTGVKNLVVDGHIAERVVVAARSADAAACSLFLVDTSSKNLERRLQQTLDPTRKQAELRFEQVPAVLLGELGAGTEALSKTLDLGAIALANESVGGAAKVLETSVDYAKTRVQFGQPIGAFQAIKHKCADVLLDVELAKSAAYYAAAAADSEDDTLPEIACLAKALCSDAYLNAAAENIQIHGGVGFTWEYDAHLYFKRAKASEVFLGTPTEHRERYAQHVGMGALAGGA